MDKQLLSGTRNPARVEMLHSILQNTAVRLLTLDDLAIAQSVEEDGRSTAANAEKKARFYYTLSRIPTLSIDGGLHIDRFPPDKQPGVLVKRIPGNRTATEAEILAYYIHALEQVGGESMGTWTGSQALAVSENQVIINSFTFVVQFTTHRRGDPAPGRVLDPLMIDPQSGKYYTQLPLEERPYYQTTRDFILSSIHHL